MQDKEDQAMTCSPRVAAKMMGLSYRAVLDHCKAEGDDRLPCIKEGTNYRIITAEIAPWLARQAAK